MLKVLEEHYVTSDILVTPYAESSIVDTPNIFAISLSSSVSTSTTGDVGKGPPPLLYTVYTLGSPSYRTKSREDSNYTRTR